ncbi:hypothetical protein [Halomicrobium sp. LC1Hm]|uniref:hypothetical protein n=1 Tax=Halomicrobium sp. LC1Hm TaxID=2610902 RepID=UPI0012982ECA|nr:hypothetical protein [Halomicrobium sp. LC1Hm]QGA84252.1 hypothetical protein LC1Hm_3235 [Halomicrobium sp. LC1Hm]
MVQSALGRFVQRVELKEVMVIPAVAIVLYLTTGDIFTSVIGPVVVTLAFLAFATVDATNNDIRYVQLGIFAIGIVGGAVMFISTDIPAWFGALVALVSLWWTGTTLIDLFQGD